jgi:hypothetical protein
MKALIMLTIVLTTLAVTQEPPSDSYLCEPAAVVGYRQVEPDDQGTLFSSDNITYMLRPLREDDLVARLVDPEVPGEQTYGFFELGHERPILTCEAKPGLLTCGSGSATVVYSLGHNRFIYANSVGWLFDLEDLGDMVLVRGSCTRF